jgi:hypothetical protein
LGVYPPVPNRTCSSEKKTFGEPGRCGEHLLEVVEDDEGLAPPEVAEEPLGEARALRVPQADTRRQRRGHPGRVPDRGEVHERHPVGEFLGQAAPDFDGEARLAHTGRSREGEQPRLVAEQQALDRLEVTVPTEQPGGMILPAERGRPRSLFF